jgi:hypothetical protein
VSSLAVERELSAPGRNLCGIAWDGMHLWHGDAGAELLYRIDPERGDVARTLPCPDLRTCTDFADGLLWQVAGRPKALRALRLWYADQGGRALVAVRPEAR